MPQRLRTYIAALALGVLITGSAVAQGPLTVLGRQDLTFGLLLPGVPITINRLDRANAGRFVIRGQQQAEVLIDLTLPAAMVAGSGATVPLRFDAADGGFSSRPALATMRVFDPRVPLVTGLGTNGRLYIFLGGTALPGGQQAAGIYIGTIALTVAYTGN